MDTLDFGVSHRRPLRVSSKPQERFPTWSLNSSQIELILFRSTTERLYFISASMLCYGIYADTLVSKTLLKEFDNNELISLSEAFLKITILRIPQNSKKKKSWQGPFLIKLQTSGLQLYQLHQKCFRVNLVKFFRTDFSNISLCSYC